MSSQVTPIFKREFAGYFRSPVAYVFLVAFLVISVALAFSRYGGFFQAGVAGLDSYFGFFPWLFLFLVPAVGMRLWSEERRSGTVELLFTLPVTTLEGRARQVPGRVGVPRARDRAQLSHGAHRGLPRLARLGRPRHHLPGRQPDGR